MRIWVIFGSKTTEHEVSIASAYWIMQWLLKHTSHDIYPIYITKSWQWIYERDFLQISSLKELINKDYEKYEFNINFNCKWKFLAKQKISSIIPKTTHLELDMLFLVFHWKNWEDWSVQWVFQMLDIPYVSTGILWSAIWINKVIMKDILKANNLPIVEYVTFFQWEENIDEIEKLWYPIFVKPANLWSSIWISKVNNKEELLQAIEVAYFYDNQIICEKAVNNLIELNCSILIDKWNIITSLIEKVSTKSNFLSFEEKYINDWWTMQWIKSKVEIPARIPSHIEKHIYELSRKVWKVLQIDWWAPRIDFLREENTDNIYINEINTIPWAMQLHLRTASNISINKFFDTLIENSLYRQQQIKSKSDNFESQVIDITVNFKK